MIKRSLAVVIALFLLVYIVPLGVRPILIPDEARYAEIPREMLALGDWVVPHLDGIRYFEKPVLGYWLNCISMSIFGENAFATRLPSALAAGISALCMFLLVRKYTGNYLAGVLTAAVLLSCMMFFIVCTINILDSIFSAWVTATFTAFFFAYTQPDSRKKILSLVLCGIFCGLAFLTKGFLAFALPVVVIVPFVLWERRLLQTIKSSVLVPLIAAAAVVLPWGIMIYRSEPDFWNYFFWTEHIKRFMSTESQHAAPLWFFVPIFIAGTLPWTALIPAIIKWIKNRGIGDSLMRFCLCWLVFCFLFFSASKGKLATYILPCFPPFAVVAMLGLLRYIEIGAKRDFSGAAWVSAIIAAGFIVALVVNQTFKLQAEVFYQPHEFFKCGFIFVAAVVWGIFSVLAAKSQDIHKKIIFYCCVPLLIMFCIPFIMPDNLKAGKAPGKFLMTNASRIEPNDILIADGSMVHAVCWFYKHSDVYVLSAGELEYGLGYADSADRLLPYSKLGEFIKNAKVGRILLIAKDKTHVKWKLLPEPQFVDAREDFVFAEFAPGASVK